MDSLFDLISPKIKSNDWKWSFSDYPKEKNGLKVFSCFACGGGSTMGYKLAGCDVLGCVEIDPKMNEIYVNNHHPKYNFCMDIRDFNKLDTKDIPEELFHLDILDGSPPCTTFSMAGERERDWGKARKFREGQKEQTLDDLSFVFIETVKKLKPRIVIMENVEGLLLGEAFSYVQKIYDKFMDCGYFVHHFLLKAENMGVPQTRHRVVFIAVDAQIGIDPSMLDMSFNYEPITYGEVKTESGKELTDGTVLKNLLLNAKETDRTLCDVSLRLGTGNKLFMKRIMKAYEILPTITASCLTSQDILDFDSKTLISANSVIKASTFPLDYDFGSINPSYVCGMSVPPIMMKRVITRLIEQGVFNYAKSM